MYKNGRVPRAKTDRWIERMPQCLVALGRGTVLTAFCVVAGMAVGVVPGCSLDEGLMRENQPPQTYLSVQGSDLDTTNYRTILDWWGTDVDGLVIGYAYRWSEPWQPEPEDSLWWEDSSWTFTSANRDTFDVPVEGTYAERLFQVRAIDDGLLADPDPPTQMFPLKNVKPLVSWTDTSRHPTMENPSLPAISFAWTPEDYDGRETIAFARLWLDVREGEDSVASAITVVEDTVGAFFPEHFQGRYGKRTVHMQLFDRAMTATDTILTWTWNVIEPTGEYLLVDNAWPDDNSHAISADGFWRARMDALVPGNYHIYEVELNGPFRSRQEVLPLFELFKGVVWYGMGSFIESGSSEPMDAAMAEGLRLAEGSLVDYVSSGHPMLITAHNLIGRRGGLSRTFWEQSLGLEEVYTHVTGHERTTDLAIPRLAFVHCGPMMGGYEKLRISWSESRTDAFKISGSLEPLLWLEPGTLDTTEFPAHATEPFYIGAVADFGSGRLAFCSTLLNNFHPIQPDPEAAVEALLSDLLDLH
ncbi:hypothetical protein ACFL6M_04080 [Candidatus Eisenbacteria bacterium]|uniref:Uncharacterized protein n=1 Tax=Eiseniibacteriota bacterium TaxID=2212470 RepID=A0ABV6YKB0_UNCEI